MGFVLQSREKPFGCFCEMDNIHVCFQAVTLSAEMLVTMVSPLPGSARGRTGKQRRAGLVFIPKMHKRYHQKLPPCPGLRGRAGSPGCFFLGGGIKKR